MRSPTRARLMFAALACSAVVALAGCGSSPDAPPLVGNTASTSASTAPSASTSPTSAATTAPTATPTPTPTKSNGNTVTKGGVATGKAADAAKTVAQAFVDGDNVATKTGMYAQRDKVTARSCTWCATKKAAVQSLYRGGGHVEGELFTKNTFTVTGPSSGTYTVVVDTTVSTYKEIDGSGKVLDSRGNRDGLLVLHVGGSKVVAASWQPRA